MTQALTKVDEKVGVFNKQVEAINQLGGVVNGIAASLVKIEAIEIARAKALAKKAREFEPEYTVEDGIVEIIKSIRAGLFSHEDNKKNLYGNYCVNYKI